MFLDVDYMLNTVVMLDFDLHVSFGKKCQKYIL